MPRPRGLGKGLSALIPDIASVAGSGMSKAGATLELSIADLEPNPYQPREGFSEVELEELAESIRLHGVLQPVLVRQHGDGYQLVAGERRWRAAKRAGLAAIPAVVRACSDEELMEMALVENLQRSDLNPVEEAQSFHRLIEEFGWTQEAVANRVGRSRSQVANYLRLLQLEPPIQTWIRQALLSVAHGKVLLSVEDAAERLGWAERTVIHGWTVRELEAALKKKEMPSRPRGDVDPHFRAVEHRLRRRFGTRVALRGNGSNGKIEIPYHGIEELDRILELLESGDGDDTASSDEPFIV